MDLTILMDLWRSDFDMDLFSSKNVPDAIRYIMKKIGYPYLLNYIDDLIYIGLPSNIQSSY